MSHMSTWGRILFIYLQFWIRSECTQSFVELMQLGKAKMSELFWASKTANQLRSSGIFLPQQTWVHVWCKLF